MALGMMTKRFSALFLIIILSGVSLCLPLFCESGKWTIAAQKFTADNVSNEDNVNSKTAEMLPSDILEKIGTAVTRNVMPEEQFERTKYKLRTERQSLFLQLSAEYKKRDSLVLANYSDYKLKTALKESQKKITSLQEKITANLDELKKATEENERKMAAVANGDAELQTQESELNKFKNLFKKIFEKDESLIQQEQISFYGNDVSKLYTPSNELKDLAVTDSLYEKAVVNAGINTLLTGHYSKYGDYISVYVDMYIYPGVRKIGSVAEVGSVKELELITTSIAMQLVPVISNSLPVELVVAVSPQEAAPKTVVYIDDVLQKIESGKLIVDSGIHTIQFISEGYKAAGTTYAFEGNKKYFIDINFEKPKSGFIQVELKKPLNGSLLMNGERAIEVEPQKSQIAINGKEILGEFVAENGETAFFYIPHKLTFDSSNVIINPKPMDRMAYIDKRRKIMYTSYSIFIISLIPTFYTLANFKNNANLYANNQIEYETAKNWQTASNVSKAISLGCGLFWGYELVRYLMAANSVLPQKAKASKNSEFIYYTPEELEEIKKRNNTVETEEISNQKDGETE